MAHTGTMTDVMRKVGSEARGMRLPSRSNNCSTVGNGGDVVVVVVDDNTEDGVVIIRNRMDDAWAPRVEAKPRAYLGDDSIQIDESNLR